MSEELKQLSAKVTISGQFECRDKDGVLLKTIDFKTVVPFGDVPLTVAEPKAKKPVREFKISGY